MSKPWNPRRATVELKPSRIRRKPVMLVESTAPDKPRTAVRSREQEIWGGVIGITVMAAALVCLIVGVSIATILHDDPGADARERQFGQCYSGGQNCVVDGGTIYVAGEKLAIAGVDVPQILSAQCPEERTRGIDSAVRLAAFLNSGPVTVSPPFRDSSGRNVRNVQMKGRDVGQWMIAAGLARQYLGQRSDWCAAAAS